MSESDGERWNKKEDAAGEFKAGNDARSKGDFDAAIKHFSKGMELDDEDVWCVTVRAAVYFDMKKYKECIADCIRAEEKGQKLNWPVKSRAKTLCLKASAYLGLAESAKDCDFAIESLVMACKIYEDQATLQQLDSARMAKIAFEQTERLADLKRELGNRYFAKGHIEEALKYYTEAIEQSPSGAKDLLARCYLQKGTIEFDQKEYSRALENYEMGLKHDEKNTELLDAIKRCRANMAPVVEKDTVESNGALKNKQANAMLDPDIQNILSDPIMRQVLIDFQRNSSDAQEHAKNKLVLEQLQKLSDAGLL